MTPTIPVRQWLIALLGLLLLEQNSFAQSDPMYKFDFGNGKVQKGYTQVLPEMNYTNERGFGFDFGTTVTAADRGGKDALRSDFITSDKPFYFSVALPEGNYNVTIGFGDPKSESVTTVKAESRRLIFDKVATRKGGFETITFTVNVRTPKIDDTTSIRLKPREKNYLNWDNKLTLEFNNSRPCISSIEITKADDAITIFLAGNSTVVDQENEPWAAWGQMFPAFLKPGIAVANYAESGEALKSFQAAGRLNKLLSTMKKGDYLFIEFAHNDQKQGSSHVEPFTTYKEELKKFINAAREKGGNPVLVTSMHRRSFDDNGKVINTLLDYPEAMRQTAQEENVPLIDLNAMSKTLYEAWGPEKSIAAFVHYPANTFPGQKEALKDNTHFSTYGAYQLAKCVIEGIKQQNLDIVKYLKDNIKYDPARPDSFSEWSWPLSPQIITEKPDGS